MSGAYSSDTRISVFTMFRSCVLLLPNWLSFLMLYAQHCFHSDCIESWLNVKHTCPLCVAPIVPGLGSTPEHNLAHTGIQLSERDILSSR